MTAFLLTLALGGSATLHAAEPEETEETAADEAADEESSPAVDTATAQRGTVLTKDFLERIPAGGGVFAVRYRMDQLERNERRAPSMPLDMASLGRVWTDEGLTRRAPDSMGKAGAALAMTPGAHVNRSGQLWLSGSRVHTIYLDGVAIDVERLGVSRR